MKKAIYPGSFDPITNGHIDVLRRASRVFDEVHIAVIQNPEKNSFFTIEERIEHLQELFRSEPEIQIEGFKGLLVDYAKKKDIYTIIRGLRAVSDFDFEFQMALTNRNLESKIDTVFLMTDEKYSYLSSSLVRQLAKLNGPIGQFVPDLIEQALREKCKAQKGH
ncbi:MAG: pantetheine-phosphate adenylyltransferase [Candidatus Margulisbacteria bacterium]|nr:pantetheine-phosphate adenylyltransferase [Candidatus Margulisiibacteriota bacterium]